MTIETSSGATFWRVTISDIPFAGVSSLHQEILVTGTSFLFPEEGLAV